MSKLAGFLYSLMFFGLVAGCFVLFYWLNPYLFYFYIACLFLMFCKNALRINFWLTKWSERVMTSIDQHWQVVLAPLLNLGVSTQHKFGNPDETASSVVGKNLKATGALRWRVIEFMLSFVLEGGKPHSIPSIED